MDNYDTAHDKARAPGLKHLQLDDAMQQAFLFCCIIKIIMFYSHIVLLHAQPSL